MQEDSGNRKIDPTGSARSSIADPSPHSFRLPASICIRATSPGLASDDASRPLPHDCGARFADPVGAWR